MNDPCPAPPGDLLLREYALWTGLLQVHATLARQLDADLRTAYGLPPRELEFLVWLSKLPCGQARMAALANSVLLSPSGLSRAVERLQARGLVRRVPCVEDRRGAFAILTDAGVDLVHRAGATYAAAIRRRFLARLSPDKQQVLAAIVDRLIAANDAARAELEAGGCCVAR